MASAAPINDSKAAGVSRKSSSYGCASGTGAAAGLQAPEQGLKCPRCDSPNTKFCYYNNYSLAQPRHFCKSCRRYWTKGGALRNVPVGGGCRKNKKPKSSSGSSSSSTTSSSQLPFNPLDNFAGIPEPKFISQTAMDHFHLATSSVFSGAGNHFNSIAGFYSTNLPLGFSTGTNNNYGSIASSIESLSSINQDLHWRLQQQRLAMLFGGEAQKESEVPLMEPPSSFVMADGNNGEIFGDSTVAAGSRKSSEADQTAWFLDSSFAMPISSTRNEINHDLNGITTWNDVQQFTALP